jgi:hypothetical protein
MPTYTVEYNGKKYKLQAEKGATEEDLIAAIEAQQAPSPAPTPTQPAKTAPEGFERAGGYGPIMAGVADAGVRGYLGVKQLFGGLDEEERAILRMQKEEAAADPNGGQRTVGNIVGNIAATAIPGAKAAGAVARGVSMLPKALQFLAPVAAGAATSGAQGLVLNPGDSEESDFGSQMAEKAKMAGTDAMFGGALAGGGQILKKALTGMFRPTAEARRLMDENIVTPTLQQGAESRIGRFIGGLTSGAIDVSKRQNEEALDAYLKQVAPHLDLTDMNVPEKVALLRQNFLGDAATGAKGEYDQLFDGKKFSLTQPKRAAIWDAARGKKGTQPQATQMATQAMGGTGTAMTSSNTVTLGAAKLREYRDLIQDAIDGMTGPDTMSAQAKKSLIAAKSKFDELVRDPSLTAAEKQTLAEIDQRYSDFLRYQEAAKSSGFHVKPKLKDVSAKLSQMDPSGGTNFAQGTASPIQRDIVEPALRVMGEEPKQDMARTLLVNAKRAAALGSGAAAVAGNPFGMIAAPGYAVSLAGQTKRGARMLFGQEEWQKALAQAINEVAPYLAGSGQTLSGEQ